MQFVKVPKKQGEAVRKSLEEAGVISHGYAIQSDKSYLYIPVTRKPKGLEVVSKRGKRRPTRPKNLADALASILTKKEQESLTTSFDVLGSLAIIEVPSSLSAKEKQIAHAIMELHPAIKTVAKKTGAMSGEFRVRPLAVIAGEKTTVTTYKESGVIMELDPAHVYFSPRLSHERKRIASSVKPHEHVLVLFAGVGPFALVIAKSHPDVSIVAVELSPTACDYLEKNVELNHFSNIKVVCNDARIACQNYRSWADRIIMPLPHTAHEFLVDAYTAARNGCIIHFYTIGEKKDLPDSAVRLVKDAAAKAQVGAEIVSTRIARPYSATLDQVVVDVKIKK